MYLQKIFVNYFNCNINSFLIISVNVLFYTYEFLNYFRPQSKVRGRSYSQPLIQALKIAAELS